MVVKSKNNQSIDTRKLLIQSDEKYTYLVIYDELRNKIETRHQSKKRT